MEWSIAQVDDIFDVINGFAFSSMDLFSEPLGECWEVLKIGHISPEGGLRIQPKREYAIKDKKNSKFVLHEGDIVMGMTDMKSNVRILGVPAMVDKSNHYALNQRVGCLRIKNRLLADNKFCYYQMGHSRFLNDLRKTANSGVQVNLTTVGIRSTQLYLPSLKTQTKIASILSAYDNLIENNNRRIRLLEQMAENLYKEWFVRFRFPGHEKVEMENGLPKGWKKASLGEICQFKRGKNITSDEMCEGNIPVISAGIEASGFHNRSNVKGVSVTMSSSGANAGFLSIHYSDIWAADCSYIEESSTANIYYVYELLNNIRTIITNFQRGAAQPHVYPKDINRIKLLVPDKDLMKKANGKLLSMHKAIDTLQQQNQLLTRQRDLLLPRLMSGKLEVNA